MTVARDALPRPFALFLTVLAALIGRSGAGANVTGWTVSGAAPHRPHERVTLTLQDSTIPPHDSLFLLTREETWRGTRRHLYPLRRTAPFTLACTVTLPDSTVTITTQLATADSIGADGPSLAISIPLPAYSIRAVTGIARADSALARAMAEWGDPYVGISRYWSDLTTVGQCSWCDAVTDSLLDAVHAGLLRLLDDDRSTRPARDLLRAILHAAAAEPEARWGPLRDSALAPGGADVLYEQGDIAGTLMAPSFDATRGTLEFPVASIHALRALCRIAPRSQTAIAWLDRAGDDTLLSRADLQPMLDAWRDSGEPEVLKRIAMLFGDPERKLYDPAEALSWWDRALHALDSLAGAPPSPERLTARALGSTICAQRGRMLRVLGRPIEAITSAERGVALARNGEDLRYGRLVLAKCYAQAGFDSSALRTLAACAVNTPGASEAVPDLVARFAHPGESTAAFEDRIVAEYGGAFLPAPLPDFSYELLDGKHGSLHELRGHVVFIDSWEIGCAGCIMEEEALARLVHTFAGESVVFLSIPRDARSAVERYLLRHPTPLTVALGPSPLLTQTYGGQFPTHVIVGHDGRALAVTVGGGPTSDSDLAPLLRRAVQRMRTK